MARFTVKIFLIVILLISFFACKTQLIETQADDQIYDLSLKNRSFSIDELGYVYLVTSRNELIRYNQDLVQEYAYSNDRLGSITSVDVNNPLKLLLFYENYQTIIVLDNLLSEVARYNLFDLGYNEVNAVGISNDNNIWVYDPIEYKLKKLNNAGKLMSESITLYNEGLEYIRPSYLVEKGNNVFLYDKNYGFYLFDNLGQYLHHIPLKQLESFYVLNQNTIAFVRDQVIYTYDLTYKSTEVFKPISAYVKNEMEGFVFSKKHIFFRTRNGILRKLI